MENEEYHEETENNEIMNVNEVIRLQEWIVNHGHSYRDAVNCVRYIAGEESLKE